MVNKSLSKELANILQDNFDLSITRKNVKWGVPLNENETIYVWFEALLNYIFSIKYYEDPKYFTDFWQNSLQICGKDNLKFQAYIFQAMLVANNIPQSQELLVHGTILDENGVKMSKTLGNVIDPIEQKEKWGLAPLKYYLTLGLSLYDDSKYSEKDLVNLWNSEIVNGLGNLIARTLHLIDIKNINPDEKILSSTTQVEILTFQKEIEEAFEKYNLTEVRSLLNKRVSYLNKRFQEERPFDKNCLNYQEILNEIYYELEQVAGYYSLIIKDYQGEIKQAFQDKKKVILFQSLEYAI